MSDDALEQFRRRWRIEPILPSLLHPSRLRQGYAGQVRAWSRETLAELEEGLHRLPGALIEAAQVTYIILAKDLRDHGERCEGLAFQFRRQPERKWIGLDASLFGSGRFEEYLRVPWLHAVLLEEIAHIWDYRLADRGSPYSCNSAEWRSIVFDENGRRRPFNVPNRITYASDDDQRVEDWSLAVTWYIAQRAQLGQRAPEHHAFVDRLFRSEGISLDDTPSSDL